MSDDPAVLLDESLVPDPDADEELGTDAAAIADEDVRGSRVLLVRRAVSPIDLESGRGAVVELGLTFHPADGARFTWAELSLRLDRPADVRILDLQPRSVRDEPVRFAVGRNGKLTVSYEAAGAKAAAEAGRDVRTEYAVYHCRVQGSGEATRNARWTFDENPQREDGIEREQALVLTLSTTGTIEGTASVSAKLKRGGVAGWGDAVRDLILGSPGDTRRPVRFEVPAQPEGTGPFRWLLG